MTSQVICSLELLLLLNRLYIKNIIVSEEIASQLYFKSSEITKENFIFHGAVLTDINVYQLLQ